MLRTGSARLCGPKNVPDPDRGAYRGGSVRGEVTLGGRRIAVLTSHSRDQLDGADAYTSALTELPAALTRLESVDGAALRVAGWLIVVGLRVYREVQVSPNTDARAAHP
jgi:hypothetical protein